MSTAATYLVRAFAVFAPELKPLEGEISAAVATVEKAEATFAPYLAGQPSFFSLLPAFVALEPEIGDIIKAAQTFQKVEQIAQAYAAKVEAATEKQVTTTS